MPTYSTHRRGRNRDRTSPDRRSRRSVVLRGHRWPKPTNPDEALQALTAGNRRFVAGEGLSQRPDEGLRRTLSSEQQPAAIVVTCADSSVAPEHVFDARLGELFVVRVAGNVCDAESVASIEHAAQSLGVALCVVLAHSPCDTVTSAARGKSVSHTMGRLIERLEPSLERARRSGLEGPELLQPRGL